MLLPHHSLGEVEKLLGLEETKLAEKEPEKEEIGRKKPRKLKQFTLQQQVEILDELVATGGNKYRQVKTKSQVVFNNPLRLAKKYKMSRSCLQYWQRNEDQIRASVASGHGAGYKVHPLKKSCPIIDVFFVRCLVASNAGPILAWRRPSLTGFKDKRRRGCTAAGWWLRKSQSRLWCCTDRWGVRESSQQVKVGWSASSRNTSSVNLPLKRRNLKSFHVTNVGRD